MIHTYSQCLAQETGNLGGPEVQYFSSAAFPLVIPSDCNLPSQWRGTSSSSTFCGSVLPTGCPGFFSFQVLMHKVTFMATKKSFPLFQNSCFCKLPLPSLQYQLGGKIQMHSERHVTLVFFAICFSSKPIHVKKYLLFQVAYNMGEAHDELFEGRTWTPPLVSGGG